MQTLQTAKDFAHASGGVSTYDPFLGNTGFHARVGNSSPSWIETLSLKHEALAFEHEALEHIPPGPLTVFGNDMTLTRPDARSLPLPRVSWSQHEKMDFYGAVFSLFAEPARTLWVPFGVFHHYFGIQTEDRGLTITIPDTIPYTFQAIQHLFIHRPTQHAWIIAAPTPAFLQLLSRPATVTFPL